jgi:hypothetical protein
MYALAGVKEGGVGRCHSWIILPQPWWSSFTIPRGWKGWSALSIPEGWRGWSRCVPSLNNIATPWLELPHYSWWPESWSSQVSMLDNIATPCSALFLEVLEGGVPYCHTLAGVPSLFLEAGEGRYR